MKNVALSFLLGACAGIIDIIPMIIQKLDKSATISAFVQWVVLGFIITHIHIPGVEGWLKGLTTSVLAVLPIVALVYFSDPKALIPIFIMTIILGSLVGWISSVYLKI